MNYEQQDGKISENIKLKNASKVIEYLRLEMNLMKQDQIEYQKEYEYERTGILIPFSGIMEFYMSEKRRILSLEDEVQRENEQEQLDRGLTKNIGRFKPTPAIILEDGDVNKLMDLVQEGLLKMDIDTESTAPELNHSSTFRRTTKSSFRTAPEFMLRILESLRGKISEVEEPEKVCELEKYISYLRLMVMAEMNHIEPVLCINKIDLVREKKLQEIVDAMEGQPGDLILTVGAGDIYRAGEALLK